MTASAKSNMNVGENVDKQDSELTGAETTAKKETVNVEMEELDPDEIENIMKKTDDIDLTEGEKAQLEYDNVMSKNFEQKIENPSNISEFLWNDFGPSYYSILKGCGLIVERVYDTKFLNEQGFLSEDLFFNDIVSNDTQELLFEEGGDDPQDYKDEMLAIMNVCISWIKSEDNKREAELYYEKIKHIEHELDHKTFYDCSPGKTQEKGVPLQETDKESAISPNDGEKEEESPPSGQGQP